MHKDAQKLTTTAHTACEQRGFSVIEILVAVALLMAVLGVVVKGMTDVQRRNFSETSKVDAVQDARDFVDQMVRDVHMVGYPPPESMVTGNANPAAGPFCTDFSLNGTGQPNPLVRMNPNISCGIVSFSPTQVIYEGDLDGSGTVSVVYLQLALPQGSNNCPCILQRGVVSKQQWVNAPANFPAAIQYFTTVNGVLNSGNGTAPPAAPASTFGAVLSGPGNYNTYTTADVFDAYDANGNFLAPCLMGIPAITNGTSPDCTPIRSLQITVNVAPQFADPVSKQFPVYSITSKARINF
jgi:hypothetical protein